jgi:hypothetical protein
MTQPVPTYAPRTAASRTFKSLVPVPAIVNVAFWMIVGGGAVTVVLVVLSAVVVGAISAGAAVPAVSFTLAGGVFGLLIRVGIAVTLRRGYGPARVYLTVVTAFTIMVVALHGFDPIGVFQVALALVPVILVWLPAANRYFRTVGQARRQAKASGIRVGFLG